MIKQSVLLAFLIGVASAQSPWPHTPEAPPGGAVPEPQRERLEMMKMWHLTEELDLSEDQASKFFPRYNVLENELMDIGKQQRELLVDLKKKKTENREITPSKLDQITKKMSELEQQKIQKKQQFFENLDDILTPDQRASYFGFELRFRKELREGIRNRRGPEEMKKRGKMGRMKKGKR